MSNYPYRIAIIGAGVSGLAAAVELCSTESERPLLITIFESLREAGGRTYSFIDSETGDTIDNGQHLMMGCYTSTLEYLRIIGTEHLLDKQNSLEIPFAIVSEHKFRSFKLPAYTPVPLNLFLGVWQSDLLEPYEKAAAIRFGKDLMLFRYDKKMSDKSCAELFKNAHQPHTLIQKLWEPIVVGTMNASIEKASAQIFLNLIRTIFLRDRRYSSIFFPTVGLSDLLVTPALNFLKENNCEIRFGQKIESVQAGNDTIYITIGGHREVFDTLVFAGNYQDISFLPQEIQNDIPQINYSPIVNAYLWIDKKILHSPIEAFIGTTLEWCFTKPSRYATQLLACTVSAAEALVQLENSVITDLLWKDILSSLPYESNVTLLRSVIIKEKKATPLLDSSLQSLRPHTKTSIPNIFLAGDLVQNGLPMTIEGAVRNGQKASKELLKRID